MSADNVALIGTIAALACNGEPSGDQSTKRAGLLPEEPSGRYYRAEYSGIYPANLEIFIQLGREEPAVEKAYALNASGARPVLRLKADRQSHGLHRRFRDQHLTDPADIAAYKLYFDQEMAANSTSAYTPGTPIGGYGGPLLAVDFDVIARWDPAQQQWSRADAPWHQPLGTVRLKNGASLVLARRTNEDQSVESLELYWISTAGKTHAISITAGGKLSGVLEVGNEVWLDVESAEGSLLLAPARPEELTLP